MMMLLMMLRTFINFCFSYRFRLHPIFTKAGKASFLSHSMNNINYHLSLSSWENEKVTASAKKAIPVILPSIIAATTSLQLRGDLRCRSFAITDDDDVLLGRISLAVTLHKAVPSACTAIWISVKAASIVSLLFRRQFLYF